MSLTHAESVILAVHNIEFFVILFAIYRPPSTNTACYIKELESILSDLDPVSQLCLVGDRNVNILAPSKNHACDYLNVLSNFGIECTIKAPFREEFLAGN